VSDDGLRYKNLLLVNGDITSMRYGGAYKSYGPQYVRGIQEMDGAPPAGNMWVTYSMNKEDMWVSRIPIPVKDTEINDVNENFADPASFNNWNIYSPLWCKVGLENNTLALHDSDPFDYAKAERVFPTGKKVAVEFSLTPGQDSYGLLHVEILDGKGIPCLRLLLDSTGSILTKQGYRNKSLGKYRAGEKLVFKIELNTTTRFYTVSINGSNPANNLCFAPVAAVERIVFRTGEVRRFPDADTPTDQDYDLPNADARGKEAVYKIEYLKTNALK
jgi:hypothetical protein